MNDTTTSMDDTPADAVDSSNPQDVSYAGIFPQPEQGSGVPSAPPVQPQSHTTETQHRGSISVRDFVDRYRDSRS